MTSVIAASSRLDAVNSCLGAIGEAPVTSLTGDIPSDAQTAENLLMQELRAVQLEGWWFSAAGETSLPLTTDFRCPLPANTMDVEVVDQRLLGKIGIQRGNYLFNVSEQSFVWSDLGSIKVRIALVLDFEELPEVARQYVTKRAARLLYERTIGSGPEVSLRVQEEFKAHGDLNRAHHKNLNSTILNRSDMYHMARRTNFPRAI